jgi:hypothetical protein
MLRRLLGLRAIHFTRKFRTLLRFHMINTAVKCSTLTHRRSLYRGTRQLIMRWLVAAGLITGSRRQTMSQSARLRAMKRPQNSHLITSKIESFSCFQIKTGSILSRTIPMKIRSLRAGLISAHFLSITTALRKFFGAQSPTR